MFSCFISWFYLMSLIYLVRSSVSQSIYTLTSCVVLLLVLKNGKFHGFTNFADHQSSPSTISTIFGCYQRYGTLNSSIRSDCSKILNNWKVRHLLLLARKHRIASAQQLLSWTSLSGRISPHTASRIIRKNRLTFRRPIQKPFFKPGHCTTRLHWAQQRKDWAADKWKHFCFPDESANQNDLKRFADILGNSIPIIVSLLPSKVAADQPASGGYRLVWYRPIKLYTR